jgi:ABC-type amino acid transport substrate-binding protein
MEDLNADGVTFVGIDGDLSTDLVLRNYPKASLHSLTNMSDPAQMLMDVSTGKADIVITDSQGADIFIKNNPGKIKRLFEEPLAIYGSAFSMRKGEYKLFNMMQEATNAALNTGLMDKILNKYDPDGRLFLPVDEAYDDVR